MNGVIITVKCVTLNKYFKSKRKYATKSNHFLSSCFIAENIRHRHPISIGKNSQIILKFCVLIVRDVGEVGDFLGIRIEKNKKKSVLLTQTGLISKEIRADSNKCATLATATPVGADIDGAVFK
jgi:hypothetical protein